MTKDGGAKAPASAFRKALTAEDILTAELTPGLARLMRVALRIDRHAAIDKPDLAFLSGAFKAIVAGEPPKKALGIVGKQGQGRKPMTSAQADVWVGRAFRVEQLRRHENLNLSEALDQVVVEECVSRSSLEKHHGKERNRALRMLALFDADTSRLRWFEALRKESETRKKTK